MKKTRVTSIRLDTNLLDKAAAFNINISRLCEYALRREVGKRVLELGVIPVGTVGISRKSRIVMANKKFKNISKIRAGESVISYNPATHRVENSNVLDVGPLTSEDTFITTMIIESNIGSVIEVLPHTQIFCWKDSFSEANWIPAKDIRTGYSVTLASHKVHSGGSNRIEKVTENHIQDTLYKLEAYPNNSFFANSNPRRKSHHYFEDYLASVWAFPIKGHRGEVSALLG